MSHRHTLKHIRDIMREADRIAAAYPNASVEMIQDGHGHAKMVCRCGEQHRVTPVSNSPRCRDSALRFKTQDVKRIFREMTG